jgi:hypothetical protein
MKTPETRSAISVGSGESVTLRGRMIMAPSRKAYEGGTRPTSSAPNEASRATTPVAMTATRNELLYVMQ